MPAFLIPHRVSPPRILSALGMGETKMGDRLKDRIAIVFGAESSGPGWGNGKAAAVAYAREGASVVCVDLVQAAAEETAAIIDSEGGKALAISADVTELDSINDAVEKAVADFGRLDILHNNVGVTHMGDPSN